MRATIQTNIKQQAIEIRKAVDQLFGVNEPAIISGHDWTMIEDMPAMVSELEKHKITLKTDNNIGQRPDRK